MFSVVASLFLLSTSLGLHVWILYDQEAYMLFLLFLFASRNKFIAACFRI